MSVIRDLGIAAKITIKWKFVKRKEILFLGGSSGNIFKFLRNVIFYLLIIIITISIIDYYSSRTSQRREISYTQFVKQIQEEKIERVTIMENHIHGKLKDGREFKTIVPDASALLDSMQAKGIDIKFEDPPLPPWWSTIWSDKDTTGGKNS
jgi:FtsH Extracellular